MREIFLSFLKEDAFEEDVTTALIPESGCVGEIIAEEECVFAGAKETKEIFESQGLEVIFSRKDGEECIKGEPVMKIRGSNKKLFPVIRTALNFMGRMSGVASNCRKARKIADKYGVKTAITRKTMPGLREFDKRGVNYTHLNKEIMLQYFIF